MKSVGGHSGFAAVCLLACCLIFAGLGPAAMAQGTSEFTLQAASFDPIAVVPSGASSSLITVGYPANSTTSVPVTLSCQVNSQQAATDPPVCTVSPTSVTVPGNATATVTTKSTTSTQPYSITITATGPTTTYTAPALSLTVLAVTPQFTLSVSSAVAPSSVPAGTGAEGTVTVNPVFGYVTPDGGITLACASITPLVTIAPVCSFTPNGSTLKVNGTTAVNATLTISTFGPVTTGGAHSSRSVFGLWFSLPLLGIVSFGAAACGKRSRRAWGVLSLFVLGGAFILIPGCSTSNSTSTTTPNGVTPANAYTFTIVGVDSNGVVSSNTSTTTSGPSVSLTVTAPPKTP